jgi:hypothetical protein
MKGKALKKKLISDDLGNHLKVFNRELPNNEA